MRLVEIETGIMIEAPDQLEPKEEILTAMAKVAMATASEVLGLGGLQNLKMRGGTIEITPECSSLPNRGSIGVDFKNRKVTIRLSQVAHPTGVYKFNADVFRAVAEGATLLEAGLQSSELVATPAMREAMVEVAAATSIDLMQKTIDKANIPVKLENRGRQRFHPAQ